MSPFTYNSLDCRGLCRIEWGQQHEGGTNSQFETFWKKLDLAERQVRVTSS
jgi:hypothetical protein